MTTESNFIRVAVKALQRLSAAKYGRVTSDTGTLSIEKWTITSLEVTINEEESIGRGSFGKVYRGEWYSKVSPRHHLRNEEAHGESTGRRREADVYRRLSHP